GAVFFYLRPAQSVLTDLNPALINVYRCIRDQVEQVIERLVEHQQKHSQDYYYQIRSLKVSKASFIRTMDIEEAAHLIYLNKTCFNGLYRENAKGEFNVPLGRYKNPKICNPDLLRSVSAALQTARIEARSFETVLDYAQTSQDFVYFDPPYYPLSPTGNFTAYNRCPFTERDQVRLKGIVEKLAERGVQVMLSNSDCDFIYELYSAFNIHKMSAPRAINANAKKRGKVSEVLVTSY
ncbi:MAG TPA: Dam family site-specific DNA-(adenine-N6)-methyltransferase, partial [Candidatus Caenarcaniphilales bacterium]